MKKPTFSMKRSQFKGKVTLKAVTPKPKLRLPNPKK